MNPTLYPENHQPLPTLQMFYTWMMREVISSVLRWRLGKELRWERVPTSLTRCANNIKDRLKEKLPDMKFEVLDPVTETHGTGYYVCVLGEDRSRSL